MKKRSSVLALLGGHPSAKATLTRQSDALARTGRLSTVRFELDHPELAALVHERETAAEIADRLTGLHVSMAASGPDLAISVWLRFRELITAASARARANQMLLQAQLGPPDRPYTEASQPDPESLRGKGDAIEALGRWRAGAHLMVSACCQAVANATPSRVLKGARDAATAQVSDLDAAIRRIARAEILERDDADIAPSIEAVFVRAAGGRVAIRAVVLRTV